MKKTAAIAPASLMLLLLTALSGLAADPYYPYQSYDDYYKAHSANPPPSKPPAPPPQPQEQLKPPPRPQQPITLTEPPEFLFPQKLGFGTAVGVPYDMFYLSDTYYFLQGGTWYRSSSYRGPWVMIGSSRLPPELRKYKLQEIHKLRNAEFAAFWKNRDHYQGRYFRPDGDAKEPHKKSSPISK
jgi:hypothetical protein